MTVQLAGAIAAILATIAFFPQAIRVWNDRLDHHALESISPVTYVFFSIQGTLWTYYNYSKGAYWGVVPNFTIVPLSIFILCILFLSNKQHKKDQKAANKWLTADGDFSHVDDDN